jgi:hypothetical protein
MTPLKLENRLAGTALLLCRHRPLWWRILVVPVHAAGIAALAAGLLLTGRRALLAALWRGARRAAGIVFLCRRI